MGMFDTVTVKYPLADGPRVNIFQTHSFSCLMEDYTVTEDGRLIRHNHERQFQIDPETILGGVYEIVSTEDEAVEFHGDLYLHALCDDRSYEYRVRFTDGVVTSVKKLGDG